MKAIPILMAAMMLASALVPGFAAPQDSELILRVAMQDDMKGLNPLTVGDVWSWNVLGYLYDGPINANPETDELIPYIAIGSANLSGEADGWDDCDIGNFGYSPKASWENASKQEAIIFYDFENVRWHDGVQMDIRDVMFSMHAAAQVPEWSSSMNPLKGDNFTATGWLHIYNVWESSDKLQAALWFQIQEPYADFFRSTLSTFLLPEHIWNSATAGQPAGAKIWYEADYATNPWQVSAALAFENNPPVGNGPFKFELWDPGQLSKISTWREHFFRHDYKYSDYVKDEFGETLARQPNIDAITYNIYKTAEAAVLALKSNDIDYIAWSIPPTFVQELSNEPGIGLQQSPETGFFYMAYNMRKTSFGYKDGNALNEDVGKPLRQAIAHCIDKNAIVQRLLQNLGIAGTGPISPLSEWYNESIPTYDFNPDKAKQILAEAGYKLTDGSINTTTGLADISKATWNNWWLNPDGTPIGSSEGGKIEIITPESNYDPIECNKGLMIAEQLRNIGIYAESIAMDFGSIVDIMEQRNFDVYIMGWSISTEPTDFLHAFFHSGQIDIQNYPGYQNASYDEIIDMARSTGDYEVKKKAIMDAQASICYDLPYDVLYFRTNLEAYRSDRFTGWVVGASGSIFNWESIMNIRAPSPFKTNAQFVSPPSAMTSNSSVPITVIVKDQDGNPLEGAKVSLNASVGMLSAENGLTDANGRLTVQFTAPYADPNDPGIVENGTQAIIQIVKTTYVSSDGTAYDPAPSRLTLIKVYPEGAVYLSVKLTAYPDIIDPDMAYDGTLGFTYVDVEVRDQDGNPVAGSSVKLSCSPAILTIDQDTLITDSDGRARFKVTATDLSNNDDSKVEYSLKAVAIHPDNIYMSGENSISIMVMDAMIIDVHPPPPPIFSFLEFALLVGIIILVPAAVIIILARKHK